MANKDDTAHDAAQDTAKPKRSQKSQQPQESQEAQEPRTNANTDDDTRANDHRAAPHRPRPMEVLREARAQFAELTGLTAESVTTFEQTEDGWSLEVEVLELARVPDTMSLMASYQVELDTEGQLTGYRRERRYERGRADAHRSGGR
ncbi:gas vesicle protein [Streptomyces sp. MK7]|uniref:gas vesicle protein GvpO n=1 Tax=Streptomyces sp. MK7 TaxID=3067635 RepID=UPI0029314B0D|nr:gas vesicle protein [Streptomyces sp. MK7]